MFHYFHRFTAPNTDYPTVKRKQDGGDNADPTITISQWLHKIDMSKYESNFSDHGYDRVNFLVLGTVDDLDEIGITEDKDQTAIIEAVKQIEASIPALNPEQSVSDWLTSLQLNCYEDNFKNNFFTSMDRIQGIL